MAAHKPPPPPWPPPDDSDVESGWSEAPPAPDALPAFGDEELPAPDALPAFGDDDLVDSAASTRRLSEPPPNVLTPLPPPSPAASRPSVPPPPPVPSARPMPPPPPSVRASAPVRTGLSPDEEAALDDDSEPETAEYPPGQQDALLQANREGILDPFDQETQVFEGGRDRLESGEEWDDDSVSASLAKPASPTPPPLVEPPSLAPPDPVSLATTIAAEAPFPLPPAKPAAEPAAPGSTELLTVLKGRVSVKGLEFPLLTAVIVAAVASAALGTLIGLLVAPSGAAPVVAAAVPSVSAAPSATTSAAPQELELTVVERALRGDGAALDELKQRDPSERSIDESLALATGTERRRLAELAQLGQGLKDDPSLAEQPETAKELLEFVRDPRTAVQALRIIAELPGTTGADLLYQVWTGTRGKSDATRLAQELVGNAEIRARASEALGVALELRFADECEQVSALLPNAIEHGDRRSLRLLGKLLGKRGCGVGRAQDCYPCLREGETQDRLTDAIKAVKERKAPKY